MRFKILEEKLNDQVQLNLSTKKILSLQNKSIELLIKRVDQCLKIKDKKKSHKNHASIIEKEVRFEDLLETREFWNDLPEIKSESLTGKNSSADNIDNDFNHLLLQEKVEKLIKFITDLEDEISDKSLKESLNTEKRSKPKSSL